MEANGLTLCVKNCPDVQWIPEHQRQEKPRAVVRPYDSHQQQQENVWHRDQQGGGRGRGGGGQRRWPRRRRAGAWCSGWPAPSPATQCTEPAPPTFSHAGEISVPDPDGSGFLSPIGIQTFFNLIYSKSTNKI